MEQLNTQQQQAYTAIVSGSNTFVTGPGGTGKSYLIKRLLETLPASMKVAITAMTGCAALLLGSGGGKAVKGRAHAKTLHSWAGIGLGKESVAELVKRIQKSSRATKNWVSTDLLIVDEVSMLTAELLEKLDMIGQHMRGSGRPFGGLQVVFMGDFYQLPPVVRGAGEDVGKHFAFASPRWKAIIERTVHLTEIVRQRDPVFQELLNAVRQGKLGDEHLAVLESRKGLPWKDKEIKPTLLFSRRAEVDTINDANLKALEGPRVSWKARTVLVEEEGGPAKAVNVADKDLLRAIEIMDREAAYEPELTLAVGAQVMLVTNLELDSGLVNGSRGVVVRFVGSEGHQFPVVRFLNGREMPIMEAGWEVEGFRGVKRMQVPLRLAYAVTIHKAQGATLDCALIDIGMRTFEYGQAYVALSRVRSLDSLYVWDVNPKAVKAHPRVSEFYADLGTV